MKLNKTWNKILDISLPFLVGAVITFLYLFFCCSCSMSKPVYKNGNLDKYHKQLQEYYQQQQKH